MATKKTISNSFVVNTVEDGERGKVGRFFYFAGDFDANNTTQKFLVNDAQAPFFRNKKEGTEIYYYYVFNPEVNGEYTMSKMWELSIQDFNNKPFEIMTNDFKYLITEALFSKNAHLGSAIINGDWMISQHGKIGEANSQDFTKFDPDFPNSNNANGTNFIPNYAVNLNTGVSYQNEAYLTGSLFANSIQTNFVPINAHGYNDTDNPDTYYLGMDEKTGQVKNTGVWNFQIVHTDTSHSRLTIVLPVDQYLYAGQRVIIYNPPLSFSNLGSEVSGGYVTIIPAKLGYPQADQETGELLKDDYGNVIWMYDTSDVYLAGVAKPVTSSYDTVLGGYIPVNTLFFGNGVVELMCVPTIGGGGGCDWCVVNIGSNYYKVENY